MSVRRRGDKQKCINNYLNRHFSKEDMKMLNVTNY